MPRSSHSLTSYFSCRPTGSPHLLQKSGVFVLKVPHLRAQHVAGVERIGDDGRAAVPASGAQVMQTLQVAALALPVADGVVDELQLRDVAEIGDREHRLKHGLQTGIVALAGQQVHLQEAFVGLLLNLDQVRNLDGGWNFRKIKSCTVGVILRHSEAPKLSAQPRAAKGTLRGDGTGSRPGRSSAIKRPAECTVTELSTPQTRIRPRGHSSPWAPVAAHCVS